MMAAVGLRTRLVVVVASLAAGACLVVEAKHGLRAGESAERVSRELVAGQLRAELSVMLGHGASHERLARFEDAMRPMFSALPKNEDGGVDQGTARFALHRFFMAQHGWRVEGLDAAGGRWDEASSTAMLKSRMPSLILELVEERLGGKHIGLPELAVLAATVEDLVHSDSMELLKKAFEVHSLALDAHLSAAQAELAIKTYLMYFISPETILLANTSRVVSRYLRGMRSAYPSWDDLLVWIKDVRGAMEYHDAALHSPFAGGEDFRDFDSMARWVEEIGAAFGRFQDLECRSMKASMLDSEDEGRTDGRVRLSKIYHAHGLARSGFFQESPDYLRDLGALDEMDATRPAVIVPNYVLSQPNCLATSGFFSVCCINECESLMTGLERSIGQPVASPQRIAEVVAALPSESVAAPRNLSGQLRRRLDEIASVHGGQVPLHGRMLAQFMHHAFPNECPYPHASSRLSAPLNIADWTAKWNQSKSALATKEEMREMIRAAGAAGQNGSGFEAGGWAVPWTEEEELVSSLVLVKLGAARPGEGLRFMGWPARMAALLAAAVFAVSGHFAALRSLLPAAVGGGSGDALLPSWGGHGAAGKAHFV